VPYEVHASEACRQRLKDLCLRAAEKGLGKEARGAAQTILARLRSDPCEFGGLLYTLHAMKLEIRVGIEAPFVVSYGVHQEKPLVFLRDFAPLSGAGF
jgi:hypothetical protein